jgi:hypothetical protein
MAATLLSNAILLNFITRACVSNEVRTPTEAGHASHIEYDGSKESQQFHRLRTTSS